MTLERSRILEIGGLLVVIFLPLWVNPFAALAFEPPKVALFEGIALVLLAISLLFFLLNKGRDSLSKRLGILLRSISRRTNNPLALPALLMVGVYLAATAFSVDPKVSLWGLSDRHGVLYVLSAVAFFLLMADALRTWERMRRMTKALVLGSVPVALYGLLQLLGRDPLVWITDSVSPVLSTMGRSNFLGAYLALVIPFSLFNITVGANRRSAGGYLLALLLQVVCLLFTLARGAWLGFLGGCLLYLWLLGWRWRDRRLLAISIIVLVVGVVLFFQMETFSLPLAAANDARTSLSGSSFSQLRAASAESRFIIWRATLNLLSERWLLGYGPETFTFVFAPHRPLELDLITRVAVDDPHNLLLDHLVSAGALGLLAFLWVVLSFYRRSLRALARSANRRAQALLAATLGSATAFLIQAQFNPDVVVLVALFWLVLALGVMVGRFVLRH